MGRTKLFTAVATAVVGGAAIALAASFFLGLVLRVSAEAVPRVEVVRIALLVAAGVGGAVALVVAYRRQRDIEQGRFVERFGAAAHQLGDEDPAVRLAGAYAMAGVANEMAGLERQQCIDVLCGYLRLPYLPERGANHQHALIRRHPAGADRTEDERHFRFRQNDKEVRQTIVRIIARHLHPATGTSWSDLDYDFTGAHLESADFSTAIFRGATVSFRGATFSGEHTSFDEATFSGAQTRFDWAMFRGAQTRFDGARFSGEFTSFGWASFSAAYTSFGRTSFSGAQTRFDAATFGGADTSFFGAAFERGLVSFQDAIFEDPAPHFDWGTDVSLKPPNVEPHDWPPTATG